MVSHPRLKQFYMGVYKAPMPRGPARWALSPYSSLRFNIQRSPSASSIIISISAKISRMLFIVLLYSSVFLFQLFSELGGNLVEYISYVHLLTALRGSSVRPSLMASICSYISRLCIFFVVVRGLDCAFLNRNSFLFMSSKLIIYQ